MEQYETLCGRLCRSALGWTEVGEGSITGPDLIRDTSEMVSLIRQRLLTAQSRQKSYDDVRRASLGLSRYSKGWVLLRTGWRYRPVC